MRGGRLMARPLNGPTTTPSATTAPSRGGASSSSSSPAAAAGGSSARATCSSSRARNNKKGGGKGGPKQQGKKQGDPELSSGAPSPLSAAVSASPAALGEDNLPSADCAQMAPRAPHASAEAHGPINPETGPMASGGAQDSAAVTPACAGVTTEAVVTQPSPVSAASISTMKPQHVSHDVGPPKQHQRSTGGGRRANRSSRRTAADYEDAYLDEF